MQMNMNLETGTSLLITFFWIFENLAICSFFNVEHRQSIIFLLGHFFSVI